MMLLIPVLLYPGMMLLVGSVMAAGKERLANQELLIAVASDDADQLLRSQPVPPHTVYLKLPVDLAHAELREKRVQAVVDAAPGAYAGLKAGAQAELSVAYTKRYDESFEALERIRRVTDAAGKQALVLRLQESNLPDTFIEPVKVDAVDIDFQKDLGPLIASRLLPIILVMMLFMGALYPAIDVTAGEKERGTLETLLVAPVRPLQVMIAKYLTVAAIASLASVSNLATMAVTFAYGIHLGPEEITLRIGPGQLLIMLACLVPAACMASGITLAVASLARNFKEAQSLLTPVTLIGVIPGTLCLMPGIELNALTASVPLLNVALLVKAVILGAARPIDIAITLASIGLCSLGALKLAANAFASESLRFGGTESWRGLFRSQS